jgi:hypothetical protein
MSLDMKQSSSFQQGRRRGRPVGRTSALHVWTANMSKKFRLVLRDWQNTGTRDLIHFVLLDWLRIQPWFCQDDGAQMKLGAFLHMR